MLFNQYRFAIEDIDSVMLNVSVALVDNTFLSFTNYST